MKVIKYIVVLIIVLVVAFGAFLMYMGFFSSVSIVEKEIGPYYFVQHERWGDYAKSQLFLDSIKKTLISEKVEAKRAFGIYYDNPQNKKNDSLHSIIGFIIEDKDTSRIVELRRKGFRIELFGKTKSMIAEFPYKNKYSIVMGISKVYPALQKYCFDKNYSLCPSIEIYEDAKITFAMEVRPK